MYETVLFYDYARKMVYDVIMEVNYFDCENKKDTRISAMKQVIKNSKYCVWLSIEVEQRLCKNYCEIKCIFSDIIRIE